MKDESRTCLLLEVQFILENDDFHVKSCFDNFKKSCKKSSWKEDKNMKQYIEYQEREREREKNMYCFRRLKGFPGKLLAKLEAIRR